MPPAISQPWLFESPSVAVPERLVVMVKNLQTGERRKASSFCRNGAWT